MKQAALFDAGPSPTPVQGPSIELHHGDCLDVMPALLAGSVQMVFADLPYGITAHPWDQKIEMQVLRPQLERLKTRTSATVFTATQPFPSFLVMSDIRNFRYSWTWEKTKPSGFLQAKKRPLRAHEDILVFGKTLTYNPQGTTAACIRSGRKNKAANGNYTQIRGRDYIQTVKDYPRSVIKFGHERSPAHPTQKPIALLEYLVCTYTNPGDSVLDPVFGSGTTAIACLRTGRNFVGIEKDATYFEIARKRIAEEQARLGFAVTV